MFDSTSFDRKDILIKNKKCTKLNKPVYILRARRTQLKKLISIVMLAIAFLMLALPSPALAADGAKIFTANCNACHLGGKNIIMKDKSLSKADLAKYLKDFGDDPTGAIAYQITNGKGAMPAFKGRISDADIATVAAYVAEKAEAGW